MKTQITTTAETLSLAVWGEKIEAWNKGCYPGTNFRLRPIPAGATVMIEDRGIIVITDTVGGFIADRMGPTLGRREWNRLVEYINSH